MARQGPPSRGRPKAPELPDGDGGTVKTAEKKYREKQGNVNFHKVTGQRDSGLRIIIHFDETNLSCFIPIFSEYRKRENPWLLHSQW
jgi:hypothetical protein